MLAARRIAGRSVQKVKASRTYATGTHGKDGHEVKHFAGSSTEHGHQHAAPANESLGTQFYFVLALIPASFAVYTLSQPDKDGNPAGITRLINSYAHYKQTWAARNTLHTAMAEQAAFDRHLFQSSPGSSHVDLKFPEIFNTGSPHNNVAGQTASLDHLVAHYEKLNGDAEETKARKLQEKK